MDRQLPGSEGGTVRCHAAPGVLVRSSVRADQVRAAVAVPATFAWHRRWQVLDPAGCSLHYTGLLQALTDSWCDVWLGYL